MTQDSSEIQQAIYDFISRNAAVDSSKINAGTLLFREGIFDSMAFVLLIDYLEEKFGIRPPDKDLIEENFESVQAIATYIQHQKITVNQ